MKNRRVLISGAGVAGPALAVALEGRGWEPVVVERAGALRTGGQAVDFRGPVHRTVLERLGLWDPIHARRTAGTDLVLLARNGDPAVTLPSVLMSGDVEILRGDLSRLLYERSASSTEYRFGDHITRLEERSDGVRVELASGKAETYGFVVGADGLHSGVRALAFGDEGRLIKHHGYRLVTYSLPNSLGLTTTAFMYTVPTRAASVAPQSADRMRALFIFEGEPFGEDRFHADRQRALLRATYANVGWEVPRLLGALDDAEDLYVDQLATVVINRYSKGRVVLLGDAGYGGTLGGQGTSLAIVGAYVLAGELDAAGGDHVAAFARYEARMRPYATACQKGAARAGSFYAPRTRVGVLLRNALYRALTSSVLSKQFEKMVKASATAFDVPDYAEPPLRRMPVASTSARECG